MKLEALSFGGMPAGMWTRSGMGCPPMASAPLHMRSRLRISPRSLRCWLQIALLLYFGVNTMRCLHSHFVCASMLAFWATAITFPLGA